MDLKILVADTIHEDGIKLLREIGEVDVATGLKPAELIDKIKNFDVLVVRSATNVTKEVISAGKQLKFIARAGVGLDNIDVKEAYERKIKVLNAPEAPTIAVAELVLGLMLSFSRKIPRADLSMKQGKWDKKQLMGTQLRGKTLGIIGTGKIGQAVADRAKAFEMNLLLYDVVKNEDFAKRIGSRYVGLETLLKDSDYITIHVPLIPQTTHMVGEKEMSLMKPAAVLINTSRGGVVDEAALVKALEEKRIAGACLDVFEKEPPEGSPLLKFQNVVLTPHIGASTEEAQAYAAVVIAQKLKNEMGK
ncbi:MAG: hydroxyacid dehydrogenase [Candidatus Hadarchaeota archaeon]